MATRDITARNIDQAALLFEEIATLARRAERVCYFSSFDKMDDEEEKELVVQQLRDIACRMGLLADMGSVRLGRHETIGGAEVWMTSPLYSELRALDEEPGHAQ